MVRHRWAYRVVILMSIFVFTGQLLESNPSRAQDTTITRIESEDAQVTPSGKWSKQTVGQASGGSYLYSSGAEGDVLALEFSGPSIEVVYVAGPALGTLAIDVDGTVLRTVITTADQTAYAQSARVNYLTDEPHTLMVYAQEGGLVAVDAFVIPPAPSGDVTLTSSTGDTSAQAATCPQNNTIQRVSLNHLGEQSTAYSADPSLSMEGALIAFTTEAALVPADNNGLVDVYVYDRLTCTIQLISVGAAGVGNDESYEAHISPDGRYVAYNSFATNLVAGDTNNHLDVFVFDRLAGNITRVSVDSNSNQGNNSSFNPMISLNGRFVVFESFATNLVAGDTNEFSDIFVHDTQTNTTTRVSIADNEAQGIGGEANTPVISPDGRFIAFRSSATNLVTGDTDGLMDVFVRDTQANTTTRVSVNNDGVQGNGDSFAPSISADGRFTVFHSNATNLIVGDTNGFSDIFMRDTQTNTTTRLSVSSTGAQANDVSLDASISANGRFVTFVSPASNLVIGDDAGLNLFDVFVRDIQTNTTTRVSLSSTGAEADRPVITTAPLSGDGHYIAFSTDATNLVAGDTNDINDIFVTPRVASHADTLALFNPPFNHVDLINTLTDTPPFTAYTAFSAYAPVSGGQWVMGDWDGDRSDSPGVYLNGVFYFTNVAGESEPSDWGGFWIGINGPAVVGRFGGGVNDCIGAVDSAPFGGVTVFAYYFTCDMFDEAPTRELSIQWLGAPLPNPAFTGTFQFAAGDFDGNRLDSIAVRRNDVIAFTNVAPSVGNAAFDLAQYIGAPGMGDNGSLVVGDWDIDGRDSFGLFYQNGELFYRNDLEWNTGVYLNQSVGTPFGNGGVQVATWR